MTGVTDAVLLTGAGVLAGLVGTAGGITSLISYPALLFVGLPARAANVANIVASTACLPGAVLASQRELNGQRNRLRRWMPLAVLGGTGGSLLLLSTPPGAFARMVPILVAVGSLTLLAQPWLAARLHRPGRRSGARGAILPLGLAVTSLYNGYFGAGSGVMILALLLIGAETDLPVANALKNMLVGAAAVTSAAVFAVVEPVDWTAVAPLGAGMFAGSILGPRVTRRLPPDLVRWLVALIGLALAVRLWLAPSG